MVSGVQAKVVQQDIRERRSNARGAHSDACALLERPRAPQTAHRIPLVGGGGGGVMTPIARNGMNRVARSCKLFFDQSTRVLSVAPGTKSLSIYVSRTSLLLVKR